VRQFRNANFELRTWPTAVFVVSLVLSLVAAPLAAEAQKTGKVPVVGVLNSGPPSPRSLEGARQGLRELDYVEGQTIILEIRASSGRPEGLPALAADLVRQKVDVLLAIGPAALRAASDATRAIPIVAYDLESDPMQSGFVRSLARPGGNITGLFLDHPGLTGKWFELVRETTPHIRRVALLWDSTTGDQQLAAAKAAARGLGLDLRILEARNSDQLENVLRSGAKGNPDALVQMSSPLFELKAKQIADFTLKNRLPAIAISSRFTEAGGLMAYGPARPFFGRRLAIYIDRILKGAKPAELPVEQPTKFELVINLKTARTLGLTFPQSILVQADEVIQ